MTVIKSQVFGFPVNMDETDITRAKVQKDGQLRDLIDVIDDAQTDALAGLTPTADSVPYFTSETAASTTSLTSFGRSLIDDASASAALTTLGVSTFAKTILDDADAGAVRTTLGVGTIATQNSNAVTITGGSVSGITDLAIADGGTGASTAAAARTNLGIVETPTPEAYGCVGDGVTNDTTNFQLFLDACEDTVGRLTSGATYLISTGDIPRGAHIIGDRTATIKKSSATGTLLTITDDDVTLEGFTIDGTQTTDTNAGGYTANHLGIYVYDAGNEIFNIHLRRLHVKNFGDMAISMRVVTDCIVENCEVERCGYGGIMVWSGLNVLVRSNAIRNIFPGSGGSSPYLNAYGGTFSNYTGQRVSTHCRFIDNEVSDIPSWEGLDEHNGQYISFINNRIYNCSQGIAVQHSTSGEDAARIVIEGNIIVGFGTSRTKDSTTFYSVGGIICNGAVNSSTGAGLVIANNVVTSCGDTRPAGGACGAIKIQAWRGYQITGNIIYLPYRYGILLNDDGTDSNLYGVVSGNVIDGTQEVSSVRYPFVATARSMAICHGNFAAGSATGGNYFYQPGGWTYETTFADNRNV